MHSYKIDYSFRFSLTSQTLSFDEGYRNAIPGPEGNEFTLEKFILYILSAERDAFKAFITSTTPQDACQIVVTMTDNPDSEKDGAQCSVLFRRVTDVANNEFAGLIINLSSFLPGDLLFKDLERFAAGISQIREITHDLNNQFQIITGFGSALQEEVTTPDKRTSADNVVDAVTKAIGYSHKLRSFFPPKLRKPLYLPGANTHVQETLNDTPGKTDIKHSETPQMPPNKQKGIAETQDASTSAAIMVVDDEPLVRRFLCEMLKRLGYEVAGFNTATEATQALNNKSANYGLAIIDMHLPGTSAEELFASLKAEKSDMRIILISGDPYGEQVDRLIAKGACCFLQKPATVKNLAEAVTKAFSSS